MVRNNARRKLSKGSPDRWNQLESMPRETEGVDHALELGRPAQHRYVVPRHSLHPRPGSNNTKAFRPGKKPSSRLSSFRQCAHVDGR
jgi:hypothetical protein